MNNAFFVRLVPSENLVIKTVGLTTALKKVSPDDVRGLAMEEGPSKFKLPGNMGNMGAGNINAKVRVLMLNLLHLSFSHYRQLDSRTRMT